MLNTSQVAVLLLIFVYQPWSIKADEDARISTPAVRCSVHVAQLFSQNDAALGSRTVILRPMTRVLPSWLQSSLPLPVVRQGTCQCSGNTCGCCVPIVYVKFGFDSTGCLLLRYNVSNLSITVNLTLDNNSIYQCTMSAANPPVLCIPIPQFPILAVCVRLTNIKIEEQDIIACFSMDLRLSGVPILIYEFDCLKLGSSGISIVGPATQAELVGNENSSVLLIDTLSESGEKTVDPSQYEEKVVGNSLEQPNSIQDNSSIVVKTGKMISK